MRTPKCRANPPLAPEAEDRRQLAFLFLVERLSCLATVDSAAAMALSAERMSKA